MRFIFRFERFHEDFLLKKGFVRVLPFSRNRPDNHSHNLGKALGKGLGLLCAPFTLCIPFTSLSYLSLPLYISPSTFLSLSLLSIILLSVSNERFRPCFIYNDLFVQDDPPLPEDDENKEKRTDDISSWDAEFLKVFNNNIKITVNSTS